MRLPVLLALVLTFALLWLAAALLRERAVVVGYEVRHALSEHTHAVRHARNAAVSNEAIAAARRGELPRLQRFDEVEVPPRPEWLERYVEFNEVNGAATIRSRRSLGRMLASVPAWFFHGAFAVVIVVLSGLALTESRSRPGP